MPRLKPGAPRKIVITTNLSEMSPSEKVAYARSVENVCEKSPEYLASTACQTAMAAWKAKTDALQQNISAIAATKLALALLYTEQAACVAAFGDTANLFAANVRTVAKGKREVVIGMGMTVRAEPEKTSAITVPTGVCVARLKTSDTWKLEWNEVPGAVMYQAQMSVDPATETSWTVLYGEGRSRAIPPLVHGQEYLLRVSAFAADGRQTEWSDTVSITGK